MNSTIHIDDPDGSGQTTTSNVFTKQHIETIVIFERLGAALSVTGVLLIFVAYAVFKRLRTVPNTFIVFASFANLGASIACLIGYSGVLAGSNSHLCQAQAFMFELFMQSDPWWSFAMAVNVYMVFFFSANPKSFLSYWWAYFLVCYGIPFIPSLWLLIVHGGDGQNVYGDATIWCWIDKDWSNLRIYTYYLPIWVCIILSTCIYIAVGYYVFKQRNQLRNLSLSNPTHEPPMSRDSGEKTLFTNAAVMGSINREVVQVTTVNSTSAPASTLTSPSSPTAPMHWFDGPPDTHPYYDGPSSPISPPNPYQTTVTRITADPAPRENLRARVRANIQRWRVRFSHMDPVKLAYLRTSFVFAISVFVTWTPSSVNRVHDLIYAESASFALNLASAVVLPLQGVWNAVIFFSTSWSALRQELRARSDSRRGIPRGHRDAVAARHERERERAVELARRKTHTGNGQGSSDDAGSDISCPSTLASHGGGGTVRVMRGGSLTSL
ncbi:uncharacterized protein F4822DRAFT_428681 [Hypoxylon trugodes]|uniref:uncharacterized protein n=1 Tax=Hypoxylon trugodes TaxID=326681 RepID=UPI0021994435|nr:uncharacterized protein F4822DRAFT_428681 [Hypoxylon trugodes]KAI1390344.1 hypothetical protein F4822DRAFT_428681 [Hypoxylon trugodes]